jgi:ribosomal protein L40E
MEWYEMDYIYAKWCRKCNQTSEIKMQFYNNCGHCGTAYDGTEFVVLCNKCQARNRNGERSCKKCGQNFTTGKGGWVDK